MRKLGILCLLCLVASCHWFSSKEAKTQKLVDEELGQIDWNDVDQYPLFDNCDEYASKPEQRECFQNTLLSHFSKALQDFEFTLDKDLEDTIYVDFLVDKEGAITVLEIEENPVLQEQIPEFNDIIDKSLKNLPKVGPAIKRSMPVDAKFRIPIVLNTN